MKMCEGCPAENESAYCGNNDPLTQHTILVTEALLVKNFAAKLELVIFSMMMRKRTWSSIGLKDDYSDLRITVDKA